MKICKSGRIIEKKRQGKDRYFLRLNIVDTTVDGKKYLTKDIATGLEVSKRNFQKANALLDEAISSYQGGLEEEGQKPLFFHQYCEKWLEDKKPSLELTSYEGYCHKVRIITSYFEEHPVLLADLAAEDVRDFYRHLLTVERDVGHQHIIGYANRTVKDVGVLLRSILNEALSLRHINENPASGVKVPRKVEDLGQRAYIGAEDIDIFLDAIKGHRLELPFTLCLYYGLRREEVVGLKWSAIHDNGKLYIEHTVAKVRTIVRKDRVKTSASYRYYPLSEPLLERLAAVRRQQETNRARLGEDYHSSGYIFTWEDGHPYSPDYLTRAFKKLVRRNEKLDSSLTLHSLRASCVSILIHSGVDVKDVQEWVGHRDIQTTMNIYARTNEKQKQEAEAKMLKTFFKDV